VPRKRKKDLKQPILILSNRLPFTVERIASKLIRHASPGGLVSALEPVLRKHGGTWIGWPGLDLLPGEDLEDESTSYRIHPVPLSPSEIQHYYEGFSNRTLWPLFHSFPQNTQFEPKDFAAYETVNERFANAALSEASEEELFWVHDYHLMLTPTFIREHKPNARVGFFLHIPFPSYDIFRLLPWDREILRGLLDCDLIAFHVEGYARNFLDCVERRLGARIDRERGHVYYGDRAVRVQAIPIGIDFALFDATAREGKSRPKAQERIVLGADRLDYTKGIPERIRAFEHFLESYPEHRGKVALLQVAVPSRAEVTEYQELKRSIDELVGQVNGRFATATWSPIRYVYRCFEREQLAVLYREADIALVTPLRDGMNLVAKEFVACQVDEPGVLILSRLAGAAETMREALLVNPYNIEETAQAIHRALTMDETERRSRMAALRSRERRKDVETWVQGFLAAALRPSALPRTPSRHEFQTWLEPFLQGHRVALFLDYDGTLTPLCEHPSEATLSERMRTAIQECASRSDTLVSIISGRALKDLQGIVGLPELIYSGNHGLEVAGDDFPSFRHEDLPYYEDRTQELAKALSSLAQDGAWVEEKAHTLTFHVRAIPKVNQDAAIDAARDLIHEAGFQAREAHCAIEARPPIGWDKGRAVLHILRTQYGPSWSEAVRVIYVGDDQTDEDAFRVLLGLAMTFRVGPANTLTTAGRRLRDVDSVEALVRWLAKRPLPRKGG